MSRGIWMCGVIRELILTFMPFVRVFIFGANVGRG